MSLFRIMFAFLIPVLSFNMIIQLMRDKSQKGEKKKQK